MQSGDCVAEFDKTIGYIIFLDLYFINSCVIHTSSILHLLYTCEHLEQFIIFGSSSLGFL